MIDNDKPKVRDLYVLSPSGREVHIQRIEPDGPYMVPGWGEGPLETEAEAVRIAEERLLPP